MIEKNKGTFVVLRSAGLGNRLKSYVSHMARYENILVEKPSDAILFKNFGLASVDDIEKYPHTASVWQLLVDPEEESFIPEYKTIDFLYNDTPKYFIDKYLPIWQSLEFSEDVINTVNAVSKNWDFDNLVGLNIRSATPCFGRDKFVDYNGFEREIDDENDIFFIASDSLEIKNYYKGKYGDRCFMYERDRIIDSGVTDDYEQNLQALVEMILLSKCSKKLVASLGSSFSECAWWLGNCKAKVVCPVHEIPDEWRKLHMIKK
jgi:hypothetical protein